MGCASGDRGEFRRELATDEMLAAPVDEREGADFPELGRASNPENDLVAVGQGEQPSEPVAKTGNDRFYRRLPMARSQVAVPFGGQLSHRTLAYL